MEGYGVEREVFTFIFYVQKIEMLCHFEFEMKTSLISPWRKPFGA